ncbi:Protein CBG23491 [Caenorhabditis briggsae]|uniref:Protein CBG23491 n=1 Tax=Caenorhabditis briggsae TaxID=6238 RepID=A8Y3S7_CAEBR|nr:Protein CBG23491 [Caenorhabditis briggsae]CAP39546.2 Protein CBG23491 [Caenorhabditis briggsae]
MGWMKFLAVVPLVKEAFNAGLEIIDDIRSDPTRKIDALKKVSAESKQKHEEAMRKLKEGQEESEAAFRRREEAANERIRIQKEENDKVVNAKTEKIRINEEQHDVEMKKMNDEHSKKVLAMRSESKEARDKAEMEHRMKVDKMENEHKNEKREAEVELKKIKEEGQLKITQAEEEKDAVSKERNKELNLFIEASKELHEINQQQIREISKRNNEFRLENCLPQHNEEPTIIPGELDEDFRSIRSAKNCFDYSQRMFRQYLINTNLTDRRLYDTCSKLITDMSNLMNADELLSICNNLPKAIDNDRLEVVKKYGKTADSLYNEFSTLRNSLENGFEQLQISHLPSAPSSQHRAIEQ